jgi:hypothetical protein
MNDWAWGARFQEAHKYGNAKTAELWQSLSEATASVGSLDIATMMDTWTSQVGFPYLELTPVAGQTQLKVTQVRPSICPTVHLRNVVHKLTIRHDTETIPGWRERFEGNRGSHAVVGSFHLQDRPWRPHPPASA